MVDYVMLLGFAAGALTTIALIPQAVKSWQTKSTRDVSFAWILVLIVGVALWLIYGILINSLPIMVANIFTLILSSIILILKIKYK